ncbi:MAG TPA: hypothetical protein VGL23_20755, partial [Chloroflexota bacterium]
EQMKQLSDSSSPMDPSMMDANGQAMPSDLSAEDTAGLSNYEGAGADMGDQAGDSFDGSQAGEGSQSAAAAQGASQRSDPFGEEASRGSAAGGGPGGTEQGRGQDAGRNTTGKILELRGRPSDQGGPGQLDDSGKVPLVASNDGSIGSAGGSARSVIVDSLSIRGEQNFVPWEKRQIVRDFFTGTGK